MKTGWFLRNITKTLAPLAGFFLLMTSACVYDREFTYLNDQVNALNRRVTQLQENVEGTLSEDISSSLDQSRAAQKTMRVELDELVQEVQRISGRVEDNEHILRGTVERDLGKQENMESTLEDLVRRVSALEEAVTRHQEYLGIESPRLGAKHPPSVASLPGPAAPAEVPARVQAQEVDDESVIYDRFLTAYREGHYERAMEGFKDYLKDYPKSDRADNAQFWIGECHMALGEFEQAILAYQNVIKQYPKGNKVPGALLRQSQAFLELKDKTSARLLLKKIIKTYPKTNEAKIAQKRLQTIK